MPESTLVERADASVRPSRRSRPLRVLVTDGHERSALAVTRSLGTAGHVVLVASHRARPLAGASRHAGATLRTPDPLRDAGGFVEAVARAVRTHAVDVVLPIGEAAMLAVLPARDALAPATVPFPDIDDFRRVCDKAEVLAAARDEGIAIPSQVVVADRAAARVLAAGTLDYPLVVKPSRSVGEADGVRQKLAVRYAEDADALRECLATLPDAAFPVLLQQRIVGPGMGIFLLVWDDRTLATFAHVRLREKPPSGGVSVYRESVAPDPDLVERSRRLLARFAWRGPAMIEFKRDAASGTPYLMEINGRFWGSLQLAVDAGVDFPRLLVDASSGRAVTPVHGGTAGIRSRWWWGDVDQLLLRLRRRDADLELPPDAPSRARAIADFLLLWRPGDRNEILRLSDPAPFLRESLAWFRRSA